jgi:hypothetical protein
MKIPFLEYVNRPPSRAILAGLKMVGKAVCDEAISPPLRRTVEVRA